MAPHHHLVWANNLLILSCSIALNLGTAYSYQLSRAPKHPENVSRVDRVSLFFLYVFPPAFTLCTIIADSFYMCATHVYETGSILLFKTILLMGWLVSAVIWNRCAWVDGAGGAADTPANAQPM
jgi:hypothetical protein